MYNNCNFRLLNLNGITFNDIKMYNDSIIYIDSTLSMISDPEQFLLLFKKLNNIIIIINRCDIVKNKLNDIKSFNAKMKWRGMSNKSDNYVFSDRFFDEIGYKYEKYIILEEQYFRKYLITLHKE